MPDQADVLNATLGGNTGTVGSGMRTIAETGAGTITITPTATPNTITSATASLTVGVPASIHTGAVATSFAGAANTGGLVVPAARYDVRITGTSGITGGDIDLEYGAGRVTLTGTASAGNAITGLFGAVPPGSLDSAPNLSLAAAAGAPPGTLHVVTTLDEVASQSGDSVLNTIVSTTNDVEVVTNQAPVADDDDAGKISPTQPTTIDLSSKTSDGDSDPLTYSVVTDGTKGHVTFTGSTATYTPTGTPTGTDTFTYRVNDGTDNSNTATVTVTFNQVPAASDDSAGKIAATHATDINLSSKTSDGDSDSLTYSVVTDGAKGHVTFIGSTATYTPTGTPTGTDTFTYRVNDGTDNSNTATVTVTFNKVPAATPDALTIAVTHATDINLSSKTSDGNGDPLTYSVVTDGAKGHVTFTGSTATYTPTGTPTGTDTFTYRVNDGTDNSNTATVTVTFNKVPTATSKTVTMAARHVATITLQGSDADGGAGGALTYAITDQPTKGNLTPTSSANVWKYTPKAGFVGTDSFKFTTADSFDTSPKAKVTIGVHVNRAPVINTPLAVGVAFNGSRAITLSSTDADGDAPSYTVTQRPSHGSLAGTGRTRTYSPDAGYAGADSFMFEADDGFGGVTKATVEITVGKAPAQIVAVQFSPMHPTTGQTVRAAVTLATRGTAKGGRIELREGAKTYWARVSGKTATVILGRLHAGTHNFTVRFNGTSTTQTTHAPASPLKVSKIPKVISSLHVASSPQQLTTKSHGTAIITVSAGHAHVDGALVTIKQDSRTLGSGRVKGGVAKVTLPRLSLGQHNLTVHYAGTSTATAATQTWIVRVALG